MQEKVKVATAQVSPIFMDKDATLDKTCKVISEAGQNGAELIVFPGTYIPGYAYWRGALPVSRWTELMVEYQKNSLVIPSDDTDILCSAAKEAGVNCVIGCSELDTLMSGVPSTIRCFSLIKMGICSGSTVNSFQPTVNVWFGVGEMHVI